MVAVINSSGVKQVVVLWPMVELKEEIKKKKKKVRGLGGVACEVDQVHYSHQVRLE